MTRPNETAKVAATSTRRTRSTSPARRIMARFDQLADCSDETGRITRLYLSPAHRMAIDLVIGWMHEAGMEVQLDAVGNVVGRYAGSDPKAKSLVIASHIDSVPDAGKFDGTLGVVMAIEAVAGLHAAGRRLPFAIEVVAFGDEEGTRFASTLGGSRALAGTFDAKILKEQDKHGITRRAALEAFGCDPDRIGQEARRADRYLGYLEVHIEQGPVLEAEDRPVGIVTAINGATRGSIEVRGESGHAGTVPMRLRRDAGAAAAEMILAIEARAKSEAGLVATVGRLEIPGGAVNTVPGLVRFSLDVRSPDDTRRKAAVGDIMATLGAIAARRGIAVAPSLGYDAPAAPCDPALSQALAAAVAAQGIAPLHLPSGAGHDAMAFRGVMPIAMLFVRCRGGISHNPAEHASPADIDVAARVLADALERIAAGQ